MKLSRYVFNTPDGHLNTMTKERLPLGASREQLADGLFLDGQERESLEKRLFKKPSDLQLRILPTWECNLRCKHCSVLKNLKRKDPCRINPREVLNFCLAHMERYGHGKINIAFVGGECLLEAERCLEIMNILENESGAELNSSLTTNFAMNLTEDMVELLDKMSNFMVSLDGDEDQHNWQRKSPDEKLNPYKKTVANLKRAVLLGLSEKMKVQAAVQDEVFDKDKKTAQIRMLTAMGIKNISYGSCHPTVQNPEPDKMYIEALKSPAMHSKPCCEYRYMNFFSVNSDNDLYSEYYALSNRFCSLSEANFDAIELAYKKKILDNLSVLKDDICMNACPVVAYCWGKCINNEIYFEDFRNNPSKYCGRESLNKRVDTMAQAGKL
jgi:sulfatase maturation enzyme AslB (radical SAM superfamily)